jgi:CRISPR/Cas system CSM-associated protein Csm4 (group 5 of RAMP superfamily)
MLEVGTLEADTARHLLENNKSLFIRAIDIDITQNAALLSASNKRYSIIKNDSDIAMKSLIKEKEKFDIIWIDACHLYEPCLKDIKNALALIKEEGILGGHDYGSQSFPGVKKAVDEVFNKKILVLGDFVWVAK